MTLTYPWFLLGLLALALPLLIHLFELRRPQRVLFTNTEFIRDVKIVTARQRKLKHRLVLLSRLGFLAFMVLVFCQPYIEAPKESQERANGVSVFVDRSPSMQAEDEDEKSVFDRAVEQAGGITTIFPTATRYTLVGAAAANRATSAPAFEALVNQLTVSGQAEGLRNVFQNWLAQAKPSSQAFVFSDFQKNDFSRELLSKLDSARQLVLVPLAARATQNVYLDSVMLDDAFVRAKSDITLRIRLRNGGTVRAADCLVKVIVGNQQAAVYRTNIDAGASVTTSVRVRIEGDQSQRCRVEIEDFPVTFDNVHYFTLTPSPKIKILDVTATEGLSAQRLFGNEPLFSYDAAQPQRVNYEALGAANLIVLQELAQVDAGLRESVRKAVQAGASVAVVPPASATGRESYIQFFRALGIGSVQWEAASSGTPQLRDVAAPDLQNPFFKDVFGEQNRQAVMPKAAPVLRWSRSGTDVLRMRDGEGYLASFSSGRGTVYLFSAPFSGGYSDFTAHALFVPVMYRLAMQSYRSDQQPAYRLDQRTITLNLSNEKETRSGAAEQVFKLVKDSITFIPSQRIQAGQLRFDVPAEMREPGFYKLTRDGQSLADLAFNYDKRESNLASYTAAELRQMIGPNRPNIQVYEVGAGQSVAAQYRAERVGTPLWRYCLWLALACLLAEVLILRFVGRTKAVEPATAVAA